MSDLIPAFGKTKFLCPHCNVAAEQRWFTAGTVGKITTAIMEDVFYSHRASIKDYQQNAISDFMELVGKAYSLRLFHFVPGTLAVASCGVCGKPSLWMHESLAYPRVSMVAPANADMDETIQSLYAEAATIVADSPRGATALLRLALQLLLKQLGKSGKDINGDIKELVSEGLSPKIQQALDVVRVVGNNAVHPGQIDLSDGRNIALKLFQVLNFIAEETITKPKELEQLYKDVIPDDTKEHISARDGKRRP